MFGRQVAKVSAKQISPLRYDSANTACFGKYACEVSNTVKCTLHVANAAAQMLKKSRPYS